MNEREQQLIYCSRIMDILNSEISDNLKKIKDNKYNINTIDNIDLKLEIFKEHFIYFKNTYINLPKKNYVEQKDNLFIIKTLNNRVKFLEDTFLQLLHYSNFLHNNCKYRLNDGHIKKIRNIIRKALNERL